MLASIHGALHIAALRGDLPSVELLLSIELNANTQDMRNCTPLRAAAGRGHGWICKILENGAHATSKDCSAITPLHKEVQLKNSTGVIQVVLRQGAHKMLPNDAGIEIHLATKDGTTALLAAAKCGSGEVLEMLLGYYDKTDKLE